MSGTLRIEASTDGETWQEIDGNGYQVRLHFRGTIWAWDRKVLRAYWGRRIRAMRAAVRRACYPRRRTRKNPSRTTWGHQRA